MKKFHVAAVEEFKKLGIRGSKFLGISCKGGEWQFIYRVSSLSQETYWKNAPEILERISLETADAGGRSLRNVILTLMQDKVREIRASSAAEKEVRQLGYILDLSIVPDSARKDVAERISFIAEKLSPEGDERAARNYLVELAGRILH